MQENTNKAIIINSTINYAKMFFNIILALLTTRFALQALGVNDFGLYSVLGSIISFIGIFNTIMVSACNRFLAVAIGKGDISKANKQFNVNFTIFIGLSILLLLIAYPIGNWYIQRYIHYDGPIENAMTVYVLSILGSAISTLAIPFHGLLMAKERFFVFSIVDVMSHLGRFIIAYILISHFENKLFIYTLSMSFFTAVPTVVYWIYCYQKFSDYVSLGFVRDKSLYKSVFAFSGWVSYGAIACVARNQGTALLVNAFFNTAMNTALGLANSINTYITMFANNLTQPMQPQITKSYAAGNFSRTDELLIMSTKYSFMLMMLISCPFLISAHWVLELWLGEVPEYVVSFMVLISIDNIVMSFNLGISNILFASGKIALYQIVINTLRLLAIIAAYFVLKSGAEPHALFYTYIIFSVIIVFSTQWCLRQTLHYDVHNLIYQSYIPSITIALLFLVILFLPASWNGLINIIIATTYLLILEYLIGLSTKEKLFIKNKIGLFCSKVKLL